MACLLSFHFFFLIFVCLLIYCCGRMHIFLFLGFGFENFSSGILKFLGIWV